MNYQANKIRIVKGGTRSAAKPLCETCASGVVMRGAAESEESIYCHQIGKDIDKVIVECSSYRSQSDTSLKSMEDVAWILQSRKGGREIGFMRAAQWRKENKYEELIPGD